MEKTQFDTVMQAIAGLKTELKNDISGLKTDNMSLNDKLDSVAKGLNGRFDTMDARFDRLENKVDGIVEQLGQTHVDVTDLKVRVSKLEGPSA